MDFPEISSMALACIYEAKVQAFLPVKYRQLCRFLILFLYEKWIEILYNKLIINIL